jgi:hypothetical protein
MENYTIIEGDNVDLAIQYFTMKKEGKEFKLEYLNEAGNWRHECLPDFDEAYKYRLLIPKENKLVPFDYSDNLIGMVVEHKSSGNKRLVIYQNELGIYAGPSYYKYKELLDNYTIYPTGAPCGKEELI